MKRKVAPISGGYGLMDFTVQGFELEVLELEFNATYDLLVVSREQGNIIPI